MQERDTWSMSEFARIVPGVVDVHRAISKNMVFVAKLVRRGGQLLLC